MIFASKNVIVSLFLWTEQRWFYSSNNCGAWPEVLNPLFLVKILTSMRCYLQGKQEDNSCVCFAAVSWHQGYSLPVQWIDFGSTLQDLALYEICHPEFPCGKITIEVRTEFVIYEKKKEQGYISQSEPSKLRARTCFTWEYIRIEVNLRWV